MCGSWIRTSVLVSSPISQSCLGFLASLWPLWELAAPQQKDKRLQSTAAAQRQGAGQSWASLPAWRLTATAVSLWWAQSPLCSTHSDEQKPPCCTQSWTDAHKHMRTHRSWNARPSSTTTPSVRCCQSYLTIQNSTHGLFSVGIINFIIWIVLLTYLLTYCLNCLTAHLVWEEWRTKACYTIIKIVILKWFG